MYVIEYAMTGESGWPNVIKNGAGSTREFATRDEATMLARKLFNGARNVSWRVKGQPVTLTIAADDVDTFLGLLADADEWRADTRERMSREREHYERGDFTRASKWERLASTLSAQLAAEVTKQRADNSRRC